MITLYERFVNYPTVWNGMEECAWQGGEPDPSKPVVSYDFDGVLHVGLYYEKDTGKYRNLSYYDDTRWTPFTAMHDHLRKEAVTSNIVVVTARPWASLQKVVFFCKQYGLPVLAVFASLDGPKRGILMDIGAVKHYDDRDMTKELAGSGVEFIHVDPASSGVAFGHSADAEQMAINSGERS